MVEEPNAGMVDETPCLPQKRDPTNRMDFIVNLPPVLESGHMAMLLNYSKPTIRRLTDKKVIPGRKVGNEWRYDREEIIAWWDSLARRG